MAPGDHEAYLRKVAGWSPSTRRAPTTPPPDLDRRAHEDVPAMYFDETFNLSDPAVFRRALCPDDDDDDDDPANTPAVPRAPAVSQALFGFAAQTRLGSHLDTIETSLVAAIGARSESFFEASARLHELDAFVAKTCETIERTRRTLLDASAYATCARESVANLHGKRANLAALADAFERLATVRECREDLDVLVRAGDLGGALEACEDLRRLIAARRFEGLRCLEDVARVADATEREVVDALVAEFVRAARVQPGSVGYVDGGSGAGATATTTTTAAAEIGRRRRRARPSRRYAPPRGTPAWKASRAPRTKTRRGSDARETDDDSEDSRRAGLSPAKPPRRIPASRCFPRCSRSPAARRTARARAAAVGSPTPCARGAARRRRTRARAFARRASRASGSAPSRGGLRNQTDPENPSCGLGRSRRDDPARHRGSPRPRFSPSSCAR